MAYADDGVEVEFRLGAARRRLLQGDRSSSIEFAYRYVDLGDGMTGDIVSLRRRSTTATIRCIFNNITSHDLKLGVRWMLDAAMQTQPMMLPPLMRRG